jgi:lysophospholipase L1-like esterase
LTARAKPNYERWLRNLLSRRRAKPLTFGGRACPEIVMFNTNSPLSLSPSPRSSPFGSTVPQVEKLEPRRLLASVPGVRVMPLGDSITEAFAPHDSYRYWLWNALKADGYKVDFVGSMHGVFDGAPKDTNFDQDHEGHVGWTADQILSHLGPWARTYKPDVVLLHLGTNDMMLRQSVTGTITELGKVIDVLRNANPRVAILMSKLIPNSVNQDGIDKLNNRIPRLIKSKSTKASPIYMVDQTRDFNRVADTYDGIHPDDSGEQKIATQFFNTLKMVLPKKRSVTQSSDTFLSDMPFASSSNGFGPIELNESNGESAARDGHALTIGGQQYARGLGVHASSRIDIKLDGAQRYFSADLGIDDEITSGGSVVFKVYADGARIFSSNVITSMDQALSIKLNIAGVRKLTLIVSDAGDGNTADHADWADARLIA